jgi:6-phosphogluconolactonase/glucosamine-6-phosphate isomerase/deaminase
MMEFIKGNPKIAADMLAKRLIQELALNGRRVLWLICGGSNISISVDAFNQVKAKAVKGELKNLYITLTDERFGPAGHPDSNWKQLIDAGFDFALANASPVLRGLSLDETVAVFGSGFKELVEKTDIVVAQFGIGADGHIAGILPASAAVLSSRYAEGYEAKNFTRVTLTPKALRKIDIAYAFVFGESKKEAMEKLKNKNLPLSEEPAQILKVLPEAYVVTDIA